MFLKINKITRTHLNTITISIDKQTPKLHLNTMSDYDSKDSHKVSVDFAIVDSEDEGRVEKKMADACREGLYWELGLTLVGE